MDTQMQIKIIVIVVLIVVLIFASVTLVLINKKDGKVERVKTIKKVKTVTTFRIRGMKGRFEGVPFDFSSSLRIGTDPRVCAIIFPLETQGVSAVHCELRIVNINSLMLVDLGSTYGTFLGNGTKLQEHKPYLLNKGMTFYLGYRENSFFHE